MSKKEINIILLGLDFNAENFGCSALGYSFLQILKDIAERNDILMHITAVNYHDFTYNCHNIRLESIKIKYKSPHFYYRYIKKIKTSDLVFDFTGGDSFTDIYGLSRFYKESLLKYLIVLKKKKLILGPQTIGPFNNANIYKIATKIMKKSYCVYARDNISKELVEKMNIPVKQTTDIAFMLPVSQNFKTGIKNTKKIKVGINISGLLYNGGYTGKNQFNLQLDYKEYCRLLIEKLFKLDYEIYLIPHVTSYDINNLEKNNEDDYYNILKINEQFPETIIAPKFQNPMEAKKFISEMDIFIGARMHATIAAFSTNVPMIAIAYSRKFEGLYNSLKYKYIIDAKKENTIEAINQTLNWIDNILELKKDLTNSQKAMKKLNDNFISDIEKNILMNDD